MKAPLKLACFFHTRPSFRRCEVVTYPFPSFLTGRDKSPPSLPAASYNLLRRCEALVNAHAVENRLSTAFTSLGTFSIRNYSRSKKSIDRMSRPVRDPASQQLNDYKNKVKVTLWLLDYACIMTRSDAAVLNFCTLHAPERSIISREEDHNLTVLKLYNNISEVSACDWNIFPQKIRENSPITDHRCYKLRFECGR